MENTKELEPWQELTNVVNSWVTSSPQKEEFYDRFVTIEDAEDGSGDGILTFPDGMCESLGWAEGDELSFEVNEGKSVIIRNTSKNQA